ncbi:MAG: SRPBCC family protein [Carbonactinosporaceae bacterium]
MAEKSVSTGHQRGAGMKGNPAVERLREEAMSYVQALGQDMIHNVRNRFEDATVKLKEQTAAEGLLSKGVLGGAKSVAQGENPVTGAVKSVTSGAKDKVKDKLPGTGGGDGDGKAFKGTIIIEEIDIGAPISVVYDQWTQFQEFPDFMKKVEMVDQEEEGTVNFKAQVLWSHRTWNSTITEQVPDEKIVWRSSGDKGYVDGIVTFHELAPRLTRVLVVLEYYPQGFFERAGNIWRAQGRRVRLELKHFRRHVMMNVMHEPDKLEGWRGEIHGTEVTRSHEDVVEEEERRRAAEDTQDAEPEEAEAEYEEEGEEEPARPRRRK